MLSLTPSSPAPNRKRRGNSIPEERKAKASKLSYNSEKKSTDPEVLFEIVTTPSSLHSSLKLVPSYRLIEAKKG